MTSTPHKPRLTNKQRYYILQNSPERFLNNARWIVDRVKPKNQNAQERCDIFEDDFDDMYHVIGLIWAQARAHILQQLEEKEKNK